MAIVGLQITNRGPYADGKTFGEVGAYERIDATVEYAVDPGNEANLQIIDLDLVPKAADGLVHFTGDLTLLKPADDSKGNRRLLTDVVNRGRKRVVPTFNLVDPSNPGPGDIPVGDGFLFEEGWSIAMVGWQWDVYRSATMMSLDAPIAPVRGKVLVEINPDRVEHTRLLANRIHKPHKAADLNDSNAARNHVDLLDKGGTVHIWAPFGLSFSRPGNSGRGLAEHWLGEGRACGAQWDVVKAGFFNGDPDQLEVIARRNEEWMANMNRRHR